MALTTGKKELPFIRIQGRLKPTWHTSYLVTLKLFLYFLVVSLTSKTVTISKKFKKPAHGILNEMTYIPFKSVSKFPCQPSLPTPGSLYFSRIPELASLAVSPSQSRAAYRT